MKLGLKFTLFNFVLLSIIIAGFSLTIFLAQKRFLTEQSENYRAAIFSDIEHICNEAAARHDEPLIHSALFSMVQTHRPAIAFAGYLNAITGVFLVARDSENEQYYFSQFARASYQSVITLRSPTGELLREHTVPIVNNGQYQGSLVVGFSQDAMYQDIQEGIKTLGRNIAVTACAALAIGLLFAVALAKYMNKPITQLDEAARKLGQGDLNVHVNIDRDDELGALAATFNEMARKVKELDELKDSFVSSVSHELRSPLTAIDGYVEYLIEGLHKTMPAAKQQKALGVIKDSTSRLSNFITNILDTAKIRAGHFSLHQTAMQLEGVISEIAFLFTPHAAKCGMNITVKVPESLPAVWADRERIAQVLTNLLGNALKFSKEGTTIRIAAALSGAFITVSVSDAGIGIPPDQQSRIFERFYQVVDHNYSRPKGTGLGLAIVAEIIKRHGGEVGVQSEPGKGSTFHFTLPVERSFIKQPGGMPNDQ